VKKGYLDLRWPAGRAGSSSRLQGRGSDGRAVNEILSRTRVCGVEVKDVLVFRGGPSEVVPELLSSLSVGDVLSREVRICLRVYDPLEELPHPHLVKGPVPRAQMRVRAHVACRDKGGSARWRTGDFQTLCAHDGVPTCRSVALLAELAVVGGPDQGHLEVAGGGPALQALVEHPSEAAQAFCVHGRLYAA
jgi:hypothetical protein